MDNVTEETASKPNRRFTQGSWKVSKMKCGIGEDESLIATITTDSPQGDRDLTILANVPSSSMFGASEREWFPNALLLASAPDLFDYAEAEEKAHLLWELGEACHREERPISEYFEALERDFPTIAQKCPTLAPAEILDWFGEEKDPLEARWEMHFYSDGEENAGNMIGEYLIALRSVALAKARGEEAEKQPCNKMLTDDLPRIPIE